MEFDESKIKPESNQAFLQLQVEEQSDACDVTVKIGLWERRYHRCILITSPFFAFVLKSDLFLKKSTGNVNLSVGTPTNINMALMYLYGKKPQLDDTNIEVMIDLAEFFLIPNLKSACVSWLKGQHITGENCLSYLQISIMYLFTLPGCYEYLESHLTEVMLHTSSRTLTFESIKYILNERKFSYFQMEDRLRFLVRWYAAEPEKRIERTRKLLESIRFEDVSISCFNEMKRNKVIASMLHGVTAGLNDPNELTDVLISQKCGAFLCFDLAQDMWYQIHLHTKNETLRTGLIADTNSADSELCKVYRNCGGYKQITFNLVTSEINTYRVVTNSGVYLGNKSSIFVKNNICVICKPDQVTIKRRNQAASASIDKIRMMSQLGPVNTSAMLQFLSHRDYAPIFEDTIHIDTTLVFIGKIIGKEVQMNPLFSVAGSHVSTVTVNKDSVVALKPESGACLFIYDTVCCTMDRLDIKTEIEDEVFPARNGFIIHNNKRCTCITIQRTSSPTSSQRYDIAKYVLGDNSDVEKIYFFCNDIWFRYIREFDDSNFRFQRVDHRKIEQTESPEDVIWKELSLPYDAYSSSSTTLGATMHLIRLPRRLLRCHVECPHCEYQRYHDDGDDDYSCDEDDDDDYYYEDDDYYTSDPDIYSSPDHQEHNNIDVYYDS